MADFIPGVCKLLRAGGLQTENRSGSDGVSMVIGLVSAGIGVTFVPSSAKKLFNLEVAYRGINQAQLTAEWVIAYRKDNQNPILKHFLDIMNKRQALLQADKENA